MVLCATLYVLAAAHVRREADSATIVSSTADTKAMLRKPTKGDYSVGSMPYPSWLDEKTILEIPKGQMNHWLQQYPHAGSIEEEGSPAWIEYEALKALAADHPDWTMFSANTGDLQQRT